MWAKLKGKRTVIGVVSGGLVLVASSLGLIDDNAATGLLGLIGIWTGVAIRAVIGGAAKQ